MLISLKILPTEVYLEGATVSFSVGSASASKYLTLADMKGAHMSGRPIVIHLQEATPPAPSPKRTKRATMKQETQVAEDLGGKRQKGSGAVAWRKGDGRVKGKYRIENKTRFSKGIRIERCELDKIRSECALGEVPLFQVNFTNRSTCHVEDQWILVPYEHWKEIAVATSDDRRPDRSEQRLEATSESHSGATDAVRDVQGQNKTQ